MKNIYYQGDLGCRSANCGGTPTVPIKLIRKGTNAVAITCCSRCHRKYKYILPMVDQERWLPAIRDHIFQCINCGASNPTNLHFIGGGTTFGQSLHKTPVVKFLFICDRCSKKTPKVIDQWLWSLINPQAEPTPEFPAPQPTAFPKFCGVCGASLMPGAPFCGNCGNRI